MACLFGGSKVNSHVLLLFNTASSLFIASTHLGCLDACLYGVGSVLVLRELMRWRVEGDIGVEEIGDGFDMMGSDVVVVVITGEGEDGDVWEIDEGSVDGEDVFCVEGMCSGELCSGELWSGEGEDDDV
ncbi:hypothetical protein Tco_0050327 [Tanacetum coccineum]